LSMALRMTGQSADAHLCQAKFESVFETQSPFPARHVRCTVRGYCPGYTAVMENLIRIRDDRDLYDNTHPDYINTTLDDNTVFTRVICAPAYFAHPNF
jgi:hypothetical protein